MVTTIREALGQPLPKLVSQQDPRSGLPKNTDPRRAIRAENWEPWPEFQHSILSKIFARELDRPYDGPTRRPPLDKDCIISSEDTVTAAYYYNVWMPVNHALNSQQSNPQK